MSPQPGVCPDRESNPDRSVHGRRPPLGHTAAFGSPCGKQALLPLCWCGRAPSRAQARPSGGRGGNTSCKPRPPRHPARAPPEGPGPQEDCPLSGKTGQAGEASALRRVRTPAPESSASPRRYASLPWMYLTSRAFSSADAAFISYVSLSFVFGLCTMLMTTMPRLLTMVFKAQVGGPARPPVGERVDPCPSRCSSSQSWTGVCCCPLSSASRKGNRGWLQTSVPHESRGRAVMELPFLLHRGRPCTRSLRVPACGRVAGWWLEEGVRGHPSACVSRA